MSDDAEERVSPSLEELWAMARRRRWWFLLPIFLCWLAVWGVSWLLPTTYESEATILVEQQKVPEHFVMPNVTVNLQDRLQNMTQQILSRTRLQKTIDDFHLYLPLEAWGGFCNPGIRSSSCARTSKSNWSRGSRRDSRVTLRHSRSIIRVPRPHAPSKSTANSRRFSSTKMSDPNSSLQKTPQPFLQASWRMRASNWRNKKQKSRPSRPDILGNYPVSWRATSGSSPACKSELESVLRALDNARQQKLYLESQLQQFQSARAP